MQSLRFGPQIRCCRLRSLPTGKQKAYKSFASTMRPRKPNPQVDIVDFSLPEHSHNGGGSGGAVLKASPYYQTMLRDKKRHPPRSRTLSA